MVPVVVLLSIAAPAPPDSFPLGGVWLERASRYASALDPGFGPKRDSIPLLPWIRFIDPRVEGDFTPFTGERLGRTAWAYSKEWTGRCFRPAANPHANDVRPVSYYLANSDTDNSLLLFKWTSGGYNFVMQESGQGMLLRVRPGRGRFSPGDGLPAAVIESILRDLLSPEVTDPGHTRRRIALPDALSPGQYATNALRLLIPPSPPPDPHAKKVRSHFPDVFINEYRATKPRAVFAPPLLGWTTAVFVLVTKTDLCLLVLKSESGEGRRTYPGVGLEEDRFWLPRHLVTKDGKSLLIDRRDKVTPPRPVPTDTITIPAP